MRGRSEEAAATAPSSDNAQPQRSARAENAFSLSSLLFYCWAGRGGASPPDDPANTRRPSASVTTRALAIFEPSLAGEPSTVTSSPTLSDFLVQPFRASTFGTGQFEVPVRHHALLILDVDVEAGVRIHPLDLRHGALERDRLVRVVFGRKRVMCQRRSRRIVNAAMPASRPRLTFIKHLHTNPSRSPRGRTVANRNAHRKFM